MPQIQIGGHRGGTRTVVPVYAEIDEDDVAKLQLYKWSQNNQSSTYTKYAKTINDGKVVHMHRFIMGLGDYKDDKRIINHIDGNGLNNKKSNLEICTTLYNSQSFRKHNIQSPGGSVCFDNSMKRIKRWKAQFIINGVKNVKRFKTQQEALDYNKELLNIELSK